MHRQVLRMQPHALGAVEHERADVGRFELIVAYVVDARGADLLARVGHVHLEDVRGVEQAPDVIVETENRGALRRFVRPDALERADPVVQRMREHVHVRFAPR